MFKFFKKWQTRKWTESSLGQVASAAARMRKVGLPVAVIEFPRADGSRSALLYIGVRTRYCALWSPLRAETELFTSWTCRELPTSLASANDWMFWLPIKAAAGQQSRMVDLQTKSRIWTEEDFENTPKEFAVDDCFLSALEGWSQDIDRTFVIGAKLHAEGQKWQHAYILRVLQDPDGEDLWQISDGGVRPKWHPVPAKGLRKAIEHFEFQNARRRITCDTASVLLGSSFHRPTEI